MKRNSYPPLNLIYQINDRYPNNDTEPSVWEHMEIFHRSNGKGMPAWDPLCYVPMGGAMAIATQGSSSKEALANSLKNAQIIAAVAPWRKNKMVFSMDKDMELMLKEQGEQDASLQEVPTEILMQIPDMSIYIELHTMPGLHGMFVHYEHDTKNGDRELRILLVNNDTTTIGIPVHLDEECLNDSLMRIMEEAGKNGAKYGEYEIARYLNITARNENNDDFHAFIGYFIQVILYICAENKDIQINKMQESLHKQFSIIKDKFSEIQKWDVGLNVGNSIRQYNANAENKASKSAHVRRAHWHHYWVGPKNDKNKRKLIIKWLKPAFINWEKED